MVSEGYVRVRVFPSYARHWSPPAVDLPLSARLPSLPPMELPSTVGATVAAAAGEGSGAAPLSATGASLAAAASTGAGSAPLTGAGHTAAATAVGAGTAPLPDVSAALAAASYTGAGPAPLTGAGRTAATGFLLSLQDAAVTT
jgi:hypothetical protein